MVGIAKHMNDDESIYFNTRPVPWWNGVIEWYGRRKLVRRPFAFELTEDDLP